MPVEIQQRPRCNLILHCGAYSASRLEVAKTSTPPSTQTYQALPHISLLEEVEGAIRSTGLKISNQAYALTQNGARLFSLSEVRNGHAEETYGMILGVRNSHDKSFPVGLCVGAQVFCCDNLSFSSEVTVHRRHTVHLQRDLPKLISVAVGKLYDLYGHQSLRFETYRNTKVRDRVVHDLLVRACDIGAITNRMLPAVLKEWRTPSYPDFEERTIFSVFNAATEILKKSGNLQELPNRTTALHSLLDTHVRLKAAHLN